MALRYIIIWFLLVNVKSLLFAEIRPSLLEHEPGDDIFFSIQKGLNFLDHSQNRDGSWGSPRLTKDLNIYTSVEQGHLALRTGVTALAICALSEAQLLGMPQHAATLEKGCHWLMGHLKQVKRSDPEILYNVWTHAYAIQALLYIKQLDRCTHDEMLLINELIVKQIDDLEKYESIGGGWGYLNLIFPTQKPDSGATSFTTATVLIILHDAMRAGFYVNPKLINRALNVIKKMKNKDFSYVYSVKHFWRPAYKSNNPGGSLGRTQVCSLALEAFGDESFTREVKRTWLDKFIQRHGWLDMARKRPIPHESWFDVAGYYYYYGHYYASMTASKLTRAEQVEYGTQLATLIMQRQEKDGSWWDFPLYDYHKYYGTSFALMALLRYELVLNEATIY